MPFESKKFLDAEGVTYFAQLLNNYPNNTILTAVINAIESELDNKADITDIPPATTVSQTITAGKLLQMLIIKKMGYGLKKIYHFLVIQI